MKYSTDPEKLAQLIKPFGYQQLTEKGLRRAYNLGNLIRAQYPTLLGGKYNESQVYLRSTDITRTKMTLLAALAAVYPPAQEWQKGLNWTPVPYTTVPEEIDFNRALNSCKTFMTEVKQMYKLNYPEMIKYKKILELVMTHLHLDMNLVDKPLYINKIYNVFMSQISLGLDLPEDLKENLTEIKKAADAAFAVLYRDNKRGSILPYESGVLLNEFFNYAQMMINNITTQAMRIYSAHHENVYAFSKISRTDIGGMPDYGATFALNLRKEKYTDNFIVEPVFYVPSLQDNYQLKSLVVDGCGNPCYYSTFENLTKKYAWHYDTWRSNCH
ncbi:testicular acid phosphatase homolog [Amyelois transitella]|uniref:testicular acid phosphatase homolog n=1 Tax=Amyelois transitella TaxID=680683 RepID=UPI00298FB8B9|nr:testicular acid phosphatase homolog [Amyelois transitella]